MTQNEKTENIFLDHFHDDDLFYTTNYALREQGYVDEDIVELADMARSYIDGNHYVAQQVWESVPRMLKEQGKTSIEKLAVSMQVKAYIENLKSEQYKDYEDL
jgi:hypothetical protein